MTDRPNIATLRDLVRDAVQSQRLDDEARDVARLLGVQFRQRARQAQEAAAVAGAAAARATTETALPMARRAGEEAAVQARRAGAEAGRRVEPGVRRASSDVLEAARSMAGSRAGRAAAVGAAAGAVASVVMGGAMIAAKQAGIIGEAPPKEITEKSSKKAAKAAKKAAKKAHKHADGGEHSGNPNGDASDGDRRVEDAAGSVERAQSGSFDLPSTIAHVGFGMALGAGFGIAHSALPRDLRDPLPTLGESIAFASAVWAVSYAGWLPALGLMPEPSSDDPGRPITMIAAHWIFGSILGAGLVAGLRGRA